MSDELQKVIEQVENARRRLDAMPPEEKAKLLKKHEPIHRRWTSEWDDQNEIEENKAVQEKH